MANYALDTPQPVEAGLTVNDLVQVVRRRRMVGLIILGACVLLTLLYCLTATRRYTATGTVEVQKEGSTGIDVSDLTGPGGAAAGGDPAGGTVNLETQASILQSDTLALHTIHDLNMENTYDFQPHFSLIGAIFGLFSSTPAPEKPGPLEDSPRRRAAAVGRFEKNLSVKVVTGTRLINVSYTNPDPVLATKVVNRLIQGLTDFSFETKTESSTEASNFLESQIADLRKKSEQDQQKLATAQKNADLFSYGTDSTGHEQLYSDVLDKLQQSTAALSAATQTRVVKEAVYKAVKSGNAELISELSGNGAGGGAVQNALNLIQSLRFQQTTLQQQIADGEQKYGTAYPRIAELHAQLDRVNQSLNDEIARVAARAKNDYDVAVTAENQLKAQNAANHRGADDLKDRAVDYTILREEANQSRTLYEDLLKKLKETDVLKGLKGSDLAIIDPARVPARPSKPATFLFLVASIGVGLLFGFGGMLVAEGLDGNVHSIGQIEQMGIPLIGILPKYGNGQEVMEGMRGLRMLNAPKSAYSEAVRSVRASLVPAAALGVHRVIVVTSANADEGKSLTARNLAVSVAQQGKRVVLVNADFRGETEGGADFSSQQGLAGLLAGPPSPPELLQVAKTPTLFLLPSGAMPPNPAELLSSPRMKLLVDELKQQFDLVLIDSPPVLPVVDALLLSELADTVLLVARHGATDQASLSRAFQLLAARSKPDSVAVVLNGVATDSDVYKSYFGKSTAHYYQEDAHEVA